MSVVRYCNHGTFLRCPHGACGDLNAAMCCERGVGAADFHGFCRGACIDRCTYVTEKTPDVSFRLRLGSDRQNKTDGGGGPRPPNRADRPRFARRPRKRKELFVIPCISNILESYARGPYGRPCGHKLWLTCASAFGSVAGGNP